MTNYIFKTKTQMKNGLEEVLKKAMQGVSEKVFKELYDNVNENVYGWTPKVYHRTKELLNSISSTGVKYVDGAWQCILYFDSSKILPETRDDQWNAHADFFGNTIDGNDIVNWLNDGTNNKFYSHPEYGFWTETIEWLHYEYNEMFKNELIKQGCRLR